MTYMKCLEWECRFCQQLNLSPRQKTHMQQSNKILQNNLNNVRKPSPLSQETSSLQSSNMNNKEDKDKKDKEDKDNNKNKDNNVNENVHD